MPTLRTSSILVLLALAGAAGARPSEEGAATRVLFLGNSYTPGGKTLGSDVFAVPHMSDPTSLARIAAGDWDFVVLQEQSVTPMIPYTADNFMRPGVLSLDGSIDASNSGAVTLLYQTWARRDPGTWCWASWCSQSFADYHAGQDRISHSYAQAAAPVGATVVPVGEAWRLFRSEHPTGNLFAADGSHPNLSGTYLAACTFYTAVFGASPVGLGYTAGLDPAQAALLQDVAARTWFADGPFCDASDGALASCPCANPGSADTGCEISQATGGVGLAVAEQATAPQNRATPRGYGFPVASTPTAVVIRSGQLEASPVVFGDGLRCVGVPLVRLAATAAGFGLSEHTFGHGATAGSGAFYYQLWFRNTPAAFCTPEAFNLSNGRTLSW